MSLPSTFSVLPRPLQRVITSDLLPGKAHGLFLRIFPTAWWGLHASRVSRWLSCSSTLPAVTRDLPHILGVMRVMRRFSRAVVPGYLPWWHVSSHPGTGRATTVLYNSLGRGMNISPRIRQPGGLHRPQYRVYRCRPDASGVFGHKSHGVHGKRCCAIYNASRNPIERTTHLNSVLSSN